MALIKNINMKKYLQGNIRGKHICTYLLCLFYRNRKSYNMIEVVLIYNEDRQREKSENTTKTDPKKFPEYTEDTKMKLPTNRNHTNKVASFILKNTCKCKLAGYLPSSANKFRQPNFCFYFI